MKKGEFIIFVSVWGGGGKGLSYTDIVQSIKSTKLSEMYK